MVTSGRAKNALIHGVYSSEILLEGESGDDFHALLDALREEFIPSGALEDELVFDLARWRWLKRRAMRAREVAKNPEEIQATYDEQFTFEIKRQFSTFGAQLVDYIRKEFGSIDGKPEVIPRVNGSMRYLERNTISHFNKSKEVVSLARLMEYMIKLESMIDARLEKTLGNLIRLKEYKRIRGPHLVLTSD